MIILSMAYHALSHQWSRECRSARVVTNLATGLQLIAEGQSTLDAHPFTVKHQSPWAYSIPHTGHTFINGWITTLYRAQ